MENFFYKLVVYIQKNNIEKIDIDNIDKTNELLGKIAKETQLELSKLQQFSDDQIYKNIQQLVQEEKECEQITEYISNIKTALSVNDYAPKTTTNNQEEEEEEKNYLRELFSEIAPPGKIDIEQDKVKIEYSYKTGDELVKKVEKIKKWKIDNAKDAIFDEFGVPINNIEIIKTVSEYVEFVKQLEDEDAYVSRGQKDCTYKLRPSLYRAYPDGAVSHSTALETEFKQKVSFYDESLNRKSVEEVRAYAQHFGLPTNYLDFTEAHLISLLFAVEDHDYAKQHSIVYFVNALSYNRDVIKEDVKLVDFSNELIKNSKESMYRDRSYFISVGNSNERIHFQKGCFLKVANDNDLSLLLKNYTKIILIEKDNKKQILKELFRLGITFENIYPDKDNVVKTIKFIKNL